MMRSLGLVTLLAFGGALAGCAVAPSGSSSVPVEEHSVEAGAAPSEAAAQQEGGAVVVRPLAESEIESQPLPAQAPSAKPEQAVDPAIAELLNTAARQARNGDTQAAAATLERALQLDPGNALLLYRLARVRFEQGRFEEAAHLATRSSRLDPDNTQLVANNWRLIAKVRTQQGDADAAQAASARARDASHAAE
jgi:tetratricopeptide (TPR) repeat protein